ncbi:unnamed protein product [Amoebophrya sp. A120]|nr:unnamed protein product [Amoebophrya sp. A120]|eukprot:GSA120T00019846001.1
MSGFLRCLPVCSICGGGSLENNSTNRPDEDAPSDLYRSRGSSKSQQRSKQGPEGEEASQNRNAQKLNPGEEQGTSSSEDQLVQLEAGNIVKTDNGNKQNHDSSLHDRASTKNASQSRKPSKGSKLAALKKSRFHYVETASSLAELFAEDGEDDLALRFISLAKAYRRRVLRSRAESAATELVLQGDDEEKQTAKALGEDSSSKNFEPGKKNPNTIEFSSIQTALDLPRSAIAENSYPELLEHLKIALPKAGAGSSPSASQSDAIVSNEVDAADFRKLFRSELEKKLKDNSASEESKPEDDGGQLDDIDTPEASNGAHKNTTTSLSTIDPKRLSWFANVEDASSFRQQLFSSEEIPPPVAKKRDSGMIRNTSAAGAPGGDEKLEESFSLPDYEIVSDSAIADLCFSLHGQWFLESFSAKAFHESASNYGELSVSIPRTFSSYPKQTAYICDCSYLSQFPVEVNVERYGSVAFFDERRQLLGFWNCEAQRLLLKPLTVLEQMQVAKRKGLEHQIEIPVTSFQQKEEDVRKVAVWDRTKFHFRSSLYVTLLLRKLVAALVQNSRMCFCLSTTTSSSNTAAGEQAADDQDASSTARKNKQQLLAALFEPFYGRGETAAANNRSIVSLFSTGILQKLLGFSDSSFAEVVTDLFAKAKEVGYDDISKKFAELLAQIQMNGNRITSRTSKQIMPSAADKKQNLNQKPAGVPVAPAAPREIVLDGGLDLGPPPIEAAVPEDESTEEQVQLEEQDHDLLLDVEDTEDEKMSNGPEIYNFVTARQERAPSPNFLLPGSPPLMSNQQNKRTNPPPRRISAKDQSIQSYVFSWLVSNHVLSKEEPEQNEEEPAHQDEEGTSRGGMFMFSPEMLTGGSIRPSSVNLADENGEIRVEEAVFVTPPEDEDSDDERIRFPSEDFKTPRSLPAVSLLHPEIVQFDVEMASLPLVTDGMELYQCFKNYVKSVLTAFREKTGNREVLKNCTEFLNLYETYGNVEQRGPVAAQGGTSSSKLMMSKNPPSRTQPQTATIKPIKLKPIDEIETLLTEILWRHCVMFQDLTYLTYDACGSSGRVIRASAVRKEGSLRFSSIGSGGRGSGSTATNFTFPTTDSSFSAGGPMTMTNNPLTVHATAMLESISSLSPFSATRAMSAAFVQPELSPSQISSPLGNQRDATNTLMADKEHYALNLALNALLIPEQDEDTSSSNSLVDDSTNTRASLPEEFRTELQQVATRVAVRNLRRRVPCFLFDPKRLSFAPQLSF